MNVKIWGLRRSGTNYLASLLKNSFSDDILIHAGGCKHDLPKEFTNERIQDWIDNHRNEVFSAEGFTDNAQMQRAFRQKTLHIYIYKDIFAWLNSYKKYSLSNKTHPTEPPFKLFNCSGQPLEKAIEKYKTHYKAAERFCYIIQYEDLIKNPFKIKKELVKKGLTLINEEYDNNKIIDAGYTQTNLEFNKDYYFKQKYLKKFSYEEIRNINTLMLLSNVH